MNSTDRPPPDSDEYRRFFRIDDTVGLSYRVIPAGELPERLHQLELGAGDEFTLLGSLALVNQQMASHLHRIEAAQPDVAAYLKALDKKVEMIGRALMRQTPGVAEQRPVPVSLSAGGLAFTGHEALAEGTLLDIRILLLPSLAGVLAVGEVVECRHDESAAAYRTHIDFTHIRDADRDVLIRHLLRRQGEMLRRRREGLDDGGSG